MYLAQMYKRCLHNIVRYKIECIAIALLLLALCIRAYWMQFEGYSFDTTVNKHWGLSALKFGIIESYSQQVHNNMLPNYPPLSIVIFKYMSAFAQILQSAFLTTTSVVETVAIKLPGNVADACIAACVTLYLRTRIQSSIALLVGALYFVHPAVMYNSAYWGQTDSLYTLGIVCAVLALFSKRFEVAGALAAAALLFKMQAIIFFPLFAIFALHYKGALRKSLTWFSAVFLLACVPFLLFGNITTFIDVYANAIGYYDDTSFNAYNFWWLLYGDNQVADTSLVFSLVTHRMVGLVLFAMLYVLAIVMYCKEYATPHSKFSKELALLVSMAVVAGAFFLFTTQMHERYLFPFMILVLPALVTVRRLVIPYILISIGYLWNLLGVLPYGPVDKALFMQFPGWDVLIAAIMCASFVWFCVVAVQEFVLKNLKHKPLT